MNNSGISDSYSGVYGKMILGKMINDRFTTGEYDAEIVDCFMKVAGKMPSCAAVYAQTAIFGNPANVLHLVQQYRTTCVKLIPTSKVSIRLNQSPRAIEISMDSVVVKTINCDGSKTDDELVNLTAQIPLD